jgi:hypothetical protein
MPPNFLPTSSGVADRRPAQDRPVLDQLFADESANGKAEK